MTFVWYSTQYKKLTWEPVKTTDVAVLLHWAVRWRKICRRDSQQYIKLLKPLGSKPPPLPAGPWLGCASTRPRRWGMQRGPPLSPGNLPHWSPRCCCGSSPAGPSLAWVWRRTHPEAHSRPASTFLPWTRGLPSRGRTCPKEQGKLSWIYIFLLPQI